MKVRRLFIAIILILSLSGCGQQKEKIVVSNESFPNLTFGMSREEVIKTLGQNAYEQEPVPGSDQSLFVNIEKKDILPSSRECKVVVLCPKKLENCSYTVWCDSRSDAIDALYEVYDIVCKEFGEPKSFLIGDALPEKSTFDQDMENIKWEQELSDGRKKVAEVTFEGTLDNRVNVVYGLK